MRTKREIDFHVEQLESKIRSESERNLKALTVAKLYYSVGAYEDARKYVSRFLTVKENSAKALHLNGQVRHRQVFALTSFTMCPAFLIRSLRLFTSGTALCNPTSAPLRRTPARRS